MKLAQIQEWDEQTERYNDEPWYDSSKAALPKIKQHAQFIERILGNSNCFFELFDLGHQLGIAYHNPETKRRWAVRIKHDADNAALRAAVDELKAKTEGEST